MASMTAMGTTRAIVAADVPDLQRAIALVDTLGDLCDFYKVGSELFTAAGPEGVMRLRDRGLDVFLDLKLHDIPNTVRAAARNAARLGVSLLTVHAAGGTAMISAAVEGVAMGSCEVLAVTVLTSLTDHELSTIWNREVATLDDEVLRLARLAQSAGAHGIVCSAHEVVRVRAELGPQFRILVPGIRLPDGTANDQSRVSTPREAVDAGADYIVLGRAVTAASDPRDAMVRVREMLR
jgi:orotidine-5'-phosphate decarboxylase